MAKTRYVANVINVKSGNIKVYASPRIAEALGEVLSDMSLYKGVKLSQVLEAVYKQGKKDGTLVAVKAFESKAKEAQKLLQYRNPGRPKK